MSEQFPPMKIPEGMMAHLGGKIYQFTNGKWVDTGLKLTVEQDFAQRGCISHKKDENGTNNN